MTGTAELIARLKKAEHQLLIIADQRQGRYEAAEAKVAAQAQEIERLKTALTAARNRIEDDAQTIDRHVAKIGKLQNALIGRDG
jgi:uncharacterized coiled-coil protein SlyX